jgi:hypothetical protein
MASRAQQISAKASAKPVGLNLALKATRQRFDLNHALASIVGGLAPLFKRRINLVLSATAFA